ncbi:MAG: cytochrome b5 domain-containing protein [Candidatus Bipolaricaulota bacterium]|jgi:predicted heme/steroid binding protein
MREITPDELRAADGRDGHPAWVAHAGQVYDVTGSFLWKGGVHEAQHAAGRDLTAELEDAPHGVEFVERFPMVGRLTTKGGST